MGKKKIDDSQERPEVPPSPTAPVKEQQGSRHKPRKMIALSPKLYDRLKQLARKNGRPLSWEARIALERRLIEAGLMTEEEATIHAEEDESRGLFVSSTTRAVTSCRTRT